MAVSPSATDGESKDVHKQYENMSYDEVSQKMAESYQQISAMLGTNLTSGSLSDVPTTPASSAHSTPALEADEFINETLILNKQDLSDEEKHAKITRIFTRAASNGKSRRCLQPRKSGPSLILMLGMKMVPLP
jgi:hypothetical protein